MANKPLLNKLYYQVFRIYFQNRTQNAPILSFYNSIVPKEACRMKQSPENYTTVSHYIGGTIQRIPKITISYFLDTANQNNLYQTYYKFSNLLSNYNVIITKNVLNLLDNLKEEITILKTIYSILQSKVNTENPDYPIFYYYLFHYCITQCIPENIITSKTESNILDHYQEFYQKIIQPYGISGLIGMKIILNMAENNSHNPYILYEAGEIEFYGKLTLIDSTTPLSPNKYKAFQYYNLAWEYKYPLAAWSIGQMLEKGRDRGYSIPEWENLDDIQLIELAIHYYQMAAELDCASAYNSLGNISNKKNLPSKLKCQLKSPEYYYKKAAKNGNIYGMYNYACLLEKKLIKLKQDISQNLIILSSVKNKITKIGKLMIYYYQESAFLGYPFSYNKLGLYYGGFDEPFIANFAKYNIYFVNKNDPKARSYFLKAATLEYNNICYIGKFNLAYYYYLNQAENFGESKFSILQKAKDTFVYLINNAPDISLVIKSYEALLHTLSKTNNEISDNIVGPYKNIVYRRCLPDHTDMLKKFSNINQTWGLKNE